MKSKFMRMVGRGVEDPEEEEQVEEVHMEEEQDKVLPQISDAEIDGFYEKFLSTGFESPYKMDKRKYVLDLFLQMEEFNKINGDKLQGGSKKRRRSRLVGGVSKFDTLLDRLNKDDFYKQFLITGLDLNKYTSENIDEVINNMKRYRDRLNATKTVLSDMKNDNDFNWLMEEKNIEDYTPNDIQNLIVKIYDIRDYDEETFENEINIKLNSNISQEEFDDEASAYIDTLILLKYNLQSKPNIKNLISGLNSNIEDFEIAKTTDVSPMEDVLDEDRYNELERKGLLNEPQHLNETDLMNKEIQFKIKYGIPRQTIIDLKTIEDDLGIDNDKITSSRILKAIQSFEDYSSIKAFVEDLKFVIEREKYEEEEREGLGNKIDEDYVNHLIKRGMKISDSLKRQIKYNKSKDKIPFFPTLTEAKEIKAYGYINEDGSFNEIKYKQNKKEWDKKYKTVIEKINEANQIIENDKKNPYKIAIKKLFLDTLKYKLIGNVYIDKEGNLTKPKQLRDLIYNNKFNFINKSEFKGPYTYDETKEMGNLYEYLEAIRYADNITKIIIEDIKYKGETNEAVLKEITKKIKEHFDKNSQSIRLVYGYYMADVDRIDNVIKFKLGETNYRINIETKFSSRIKSGVVNTLQSKSKENKYPFVYTGLTKILLLMDKYLNSKENEKVYSYNTLYFKDDDNVFDKIMEDDKYNVLPNSASILSIQKLCEILNIKKEDIKNMDTDTKHIDNLNAIFNLLNDRIRPLLIKQIGDKYGINNEDKDFVNEYISNKNSKTKLIEDKYSGNIDKIEKIKKIITAIERRGINRVQENIYLDIPALYSLGIGYDLDLDNPNSINTKKRDILINNYFYNIDDKYNFESKKGKKVYTKEYIKSFVQPKSSKKPLEVMLSETEKGTEYENPLPSNKEVQEIIKDLLTYDKDMLGKYFKKFRGTDNYGFRSNKEFAVFVNDIDDIQNKIIELKLKSQSPISKSKGTPKSQEMEKQIEKELDVRTLGVETSEGVKPITLFKVETKPKEGSPLNPNKKK